MSLSQPLEMKGLSFRLAGLRQTEQNIMPAKKTPSSKNTSIAKAKLEANKAQALARMSMLELLESAVDNRGIPLNDKVVTVLVDAMEAEKEDGQPDHAIRLRSAEQFMNRTLGLPVKREEKIHRTVTTDDDVQELLNTSEAFRETVEKMLDKAKTVADV